MTTAYSAPARAHNRSLERWLGHFGLTRAWVQHWLTTLPPGPRHTVLTQRLAGATYTEAGLAAGMSRELARQHEVRSLRQAAKEKADLSRNAFPFRAGPSAVRTPPPHPETA